MTATPAPAPPAEKNAAEKGTSYVVLEQGGAEGAYTFVAKLTATSANAAIRKAGENAGAGTYIAVPERSFVSQKVTVETTKTVRFG